MGKHKTMKQLYFKTSSEWREWLHENHDKENELWLIFYKKETGLPSIDYESAVEEALCYGWIDSIIKKIDEQRYAQKFTPRKLKSKWSPSNKTRVNKLIKVGRMTPAGQVKIDAAKANGMWNKSDRPVLSLEIPLEFKKALDQNKKAKEYFNSLATSYKKQYIGWIVTAKKEETRKKRINESIALLEKGEKLGMK